MQSSSYIPIIFWHAWIASNPYLLALLLVQVPQYKGWGSLYQPRSELATLMHTPWASQYFDHTTIHQLLQSLDLEVEKDAGYTYGPALEAFIKAGG